MSLNLSRNHLNHSTKCFVRNDAWGIPENQEMTNNRGAQPTLNSQHPMKTKTIKEKPHKKFSHDKFIVFSFYFISLFFCMVFVSQVFFLFAIRSLSGLILSSFPLIFPVFFGLSTNSFFSFSLQFVRFYTFDLYAGWNVELSTTFHIDLFCVHFGKKNKIKTPRDKKTTNRDELKYRERISRFSSVITSI